MKSKLLITLLALACIISCVFALVACDPSDLPKGTGDDDTTIGVEVTAEQWSTLWDNVGNFKLEVSYNGAIYSTIKIDGAKTWFVDESRHEEILVKEDGKYYRYEKDADSGWTRYVIPEGSEMGVMATSELLEYFKDQYTQFRYSDGVYVAEVVNVSDDVSFKNIKAVVTKDGLVSIEFDVPVSSTGGDSDWLKYAFKDIGKTTVTIPADYTDKNGGDDDKPNPDTAQVTEEQWIKIMSSIYNYTATLTKNGSVVEILKFDGVSQLNDTVTKKKLITKEGENYYRYFTSDGGWIKTDISESSYNVYSTIHILNYYKDYYNEFTFANGMYTADILKGSSELQKNFKVVFANGALVSFECEACDEVSSYSDKIVLDSVGSTTVEIPKEYTYIEPIICPIEPGEKLVMPVGTKVAALYEKYPTLITDDGKWELYVDINGEWRKMTDNDAVPYENQFVCKLVFNGDAIIVPGDVMFLIIGIQDAGGDDPIASVTCPMPEGKTVEVPIKSTVKSFYDSMPSLTNEYGRWELYANANGKWTLLNDEYQFDEIGSVSCKLVFNGDIDVSLQDVEFTIVVRADGEVVEGSQVTADEWEQILGAVNNFMVTVSKDNDSFFFSLVDNNAMFQKYYTDETVIVKENGKQYLYRYTNGKWIKTIASDDDLVFDYFDLVKLFKADYSLFKCVGSSYEANRIDKSDTALGGVTTNVKVSFERGKLNGIEFTWQSEGTPLKFVVSQVGDTVVYIPEDYVNETGESETPVTEAEWAQIMQSAVNFAVDVPKEGNYRAIVKIDHDKLMIEASTSDRKIITKNGDRYYQYYEYGTWMRKVVDASYYEPYYLYSQFVRMFKDDYSAFTFLNGVYSAATLDKTEIIGSAINNVKIKFKSGAIVSIEFEAENGSSNFKYNITNIGSAAVDIPAGFCVECPIQSNQTVELTVGTPIWELYNKYPALSDDDGMWQLHVRNYGSGSDTEGYIQIQDDSVLIYEGVFPCRLIYRGNGSGNGYGETTEFTLVGVSDSEHPLQIGPFTQNEWQQKLDNDNNFTVEMQKDNVKNVVKIANGLKYYDDGDVVIIVQQNNGKEYLYTCKDSVWTKTIKDSDVSVFDYSVLLGLFKEDYYQFTYSSGVYSAESIDKSNSELGTVVEQVKITFEYSSVVKVEFVLRNTQTLIKITDIKSTNFELPKEYDDQTGESNIPEVGDDLTDEEWAQLLERANDNYWCRIFEDGSDITSEIMTIMIDGDKRAYNTDGKSFVFVKDGGNYYQYLYENASCTKSALTKTQYESYIGIYPDFIGMFKEDHAKFTYSNGSYFAFSIDKTDCDLGQIDGITITVQDGEVVKVEFYIDSTKYFLVENIGAVNIVLPDDYIDKTGEEVTAEQWSQILESASQYTVEVYSDVTLLGTIEVDGAKLKQETNANEEQIITKEGDKYYQYYDDSGWKKKEIEVGVNHPYNLYMQVIRMFKDNYSDFSFVNGSYNGNLDKSDTALGGNASNIKITFTNGAIVRFEFEGDVKFVVKNIGNTTIDLPTEYTELTAE